MMQREELTDEKGVYVMHLYLEEPVVLIIGALGRTHFPEGNYLYVGSAFGPGGLRARIGRHLCGTGKAHWHIDYLRRSALVLGGYYYVPAALDGASPSECASSLNSYECCWSQAISALANVTVPVYGFGASDCQSGCSAHLFLFNSPKKQATNNENRKLLKEILSASIHIEFSEIHWIQTHKSNQAI